jgi:uncharacterized membrane protein
VFDIFDPIFMFLELLVIFFPIWVIVAFVRWLVWRRRLRRIRSALDALRSEVGALHREVSGLRSALSGTRVSAAPSPAPTVEPAPAAPAAEAIPQVVPVQAVAEERRAAAAPLPVAEALAAPGPAPAPIAPAAVEPAPRAPAIGLRAPRRAFERLLAALRAVSGEAELEMLIGGRWLNKIGVAVLVIGMALLLNFALDYMGPPGKVMLGASVGGALTLGGVWLEWRRGYAVIARSLVGGGWALLYFTAFAAHNVAAAKVIDDPVLGLAVLSVVAGAMIAHSLRYKSQVATGLAFLVGFLAIDISPLTIYSLAAAAILAASLVAILRRAAWPWLGISGVVATYLTHLIWSVWSHPPEGTTPTQAFWLSQGVLAIYWLLFASCDLRRPAADRPGRRLGLASNLANTLGFFALSANQTWTQFPDHLYVLAGAGAAAYVVKSALIHRSGWRVLHLVDGSLAIAGGAAAAALAIRPLWVPAEWLAAALLMEAALALAVGFRLPEFTFRFGGYMLAGAALFFGLAFNVLALHGLYDLGGIGGADRQEILDILRMLYVEPSGLRTLRWATVMPIIGCLFLLERLQTIFGRGQARADERTFARAAGHGAVALLAALLWQEVTRGYIGLAWLGSGFVLFQLGLWTRHVHRRVQGYALCVVAAAAMVLINLDGVLAPATGALPSRWVVVLPAVAAGFYIYWRLLQPATQAVTTGLELRLHPWASHAATGLLAILLWKELDPPAVALAWGALALVVYEIGSALKLSPLVLQSQALAAAAFGRLFLANFTTTGRAFGLSIRLLTVVPVIALLYYRNFAARTSPFLGSVARLEERAAPVYLYAGAFGLAVLARFEFDRAHAVIAWAALSILYLAVGVKIEDRDYRIQSYLLAIAAFLRSWNTNFYLTGSYYGLSERVATTVPVIASLFAAGLLWRTQRTRLAQAIAEPGLRAYVALLDAKSRFIMSILASVLLASLLHYTIKGNLLTIAWGAQGLILLVAGFGVAERALRLCGLGLLAVCLFKVIVIDLSGVETIYRIFSFIVLGVILVAASFIYTRYRDQLKRYL